MQAGIGVLINKDFPETIQEVHHKTSALDVGKAQNTVNSSAQQGTALARNVAKGSLHLILFFQRCITLKRGQ